MDEKQIEALQTRAAELTTKNLELEGRAKMAESALATITKERDDLGTRSAALDTQNKALVVERDAASKRADSAEDKVIGLEVDALVGKKIAPAERDTYVRLRKVDPKLFDDMIGQRQVMPHETQIIPGAGNGAPPPPAGDKRGAASVDDINDRLLKAADAKG